MSDAQIVPIQKNQIGMTSRGLELTSLDDLWRFCKIVAETPFCPRGSSPETCLVAIQFGAEVGLTAMQALQNVAVINGKPALFGDAPLALCRMAPGWTPGVFKEWTEGEGVNMVAYCRVGRRDEETVTRSFSWADAVKAGLTGSDTYKKYPQRMLMFRARGWALRDLYGDVLKGLWSEHEARDMGESSRTTRVDLGGKESFTNARTIDVTPPKPAKVEPQEGGDWTGDKLEKAKPGRPKGRMASSLKTPEKAADPAMERLERQEAAAEAKEEPKDRDTIVMLRRYSARMKEHGLKWQDFVKGDPHAMTDEVLERIMLRMEDAMTDAAFEKQAQNGPEDEHPEREPGSDD